MKRDLHITQTNTLINVRNSACSAMRHNEKEFDLGNGYRKQFETDAGKVIRDFDRGLITFKEALQEIVEIM